MNEFYDLIKYNFAPLNTHQITFEVKFICNDSVFGTLIEKLSVSKILCHAIRLRNHKTENSRIN